MNNIQVESNTRGNNIYTEYLFPAKVKRTLLYNTALQMVAWWSYVAFTSLILFTFVLNLIDQLGCTHHRRVSVF